MKPQQRQHQPSQRLFHDSADEPRYLMLASEATLAGLTREQVIAALHSRIRRDEGYLAYRKVSGRHTSYDEQVQHDLRAMALAICYLEEAPRK